MIMQLGLIFYPSCTFPQIAYNGSFEYVNLENFPLVWNDVSTKKHYIVQADTNITFSGKRSLHVIPIDSLQTRGMSLILHQKFNLQRIKKQPKVRISFYSTLKEDQVVDVYPYMRRTCTSDKNPDFKRKIEVISKNNTVWRKITFESQMDTSCNWV